ncbi:MAG: hypothetical protein FGM33_07090 [Candidatus Kapabacteria bacterium]|nr:hypothetical protein [Candidatus Kapabacteria bacterium]
MKSILTFVFLGIIALGGCSTPAEPELSAQQLMVDDLVKTPGFTWFVAEMNRFSPRAELLPPITAAFGASSGKKVCIFVKASCSCRGTQRLFPQIVKTLLDANVSEDRIEVWSMRTEKDRHPYEGLVSISALPSIYVIDNGVVRDSVQDYDYNESNADSLIARAVVR